MAQLETRIDRRAPEFRANDEALRGAVADLRARVA
jgi:hypothetical protein